MSGFCVYGYGVIVKPVALLLEKDGLKFFLPLSKRECKYIH